MTSDIHQTLEFIKHVRDSLEASYSHLWDKTREVIDNRKLSKADQSHLEWGLSHMYKSKEEFMRDLDRHSETLQHELNKENNAGKPL